MLALTALLLAAPVVMRLPDGARCPDAVADSGSVHVAYGDGQDAWYTKYGTDLRVRIDSDGGTVHAGGERGPKIAVGDKAVYCAWQGDYRKGPAVWFSRSTDGGKSFEPQRNLIQGKTPGLDEIAISGSGSLVAVFWLDGRGGKDTDAPTTSTIWYSLSTDSGKTFGPNQHITSDAKVRACACCTFLAEVHKDGWATVIYRSGIGNVRDIWRLQGSVQSNQWRSTRLTNSNWIFAGCPMDGPRCDGPSLAYSVEGKAFLTGNGATKPLELGTGKYANVVSAGQEFATWQEGTTLHWRYMSSGEAGTIDVGQDRVAVAVTPDKRPLIIH
jgi:hypothetical protein